MMRDLQIWQNQRRASKYNIHNKISSLGDVFSTFKVLILNSLYFISFSPLETRIRMECDRKPRGKYSYWRTHS